MSLDSRQEYWCETNCEVYSYASLNIVSTDNSTIYDFIDNWEGNSFVGEKSIGIGCVENNIIWRYNSSDIDEGGEYSNSREVSEMLLKSSPTNLITVDLERYKYSGGTAAPTCYSHFANVVVVE